MAPRPPPIISSSTASTPTIFRKIPLRDSHPSRVSPFRLRTLSPNSRCKPRCTTPDTDAAPAPTWTSSARSGSNQFHGELWEFFRNDALHANYFSPNKTPQPGPVLDQTQFGGTFGGPTRRDKPFFFGPYQGSVQPNGQAPGALASAFLPPLTDDRPPAALGKIFGGQ